jgi:hypothetical protein
MAIPYPNKGFNCNPYGVEGSTNLSQKNLEPEDKE